MKRWIINRIWPVIFLSAAANLTANGPAFAQSGRRQQSSTPVVVVAPPQSPGRSRTTSDVPAGNSSGKSQASSAPKPKSDSDEVDVGDVVKVNSNLVTVPASVVDANGVVVSNLKLEDFELLVDGSPKPISDLFRSDTPVRLALLFDNSSSLTTSRELEKQAAIRFFKRVMRPQDQAAVYNVYNEVILAQPLTGDVRALVRTIENFGKPELAQELAFSTVTARRFCDQQEMSLQTATGRSLP